MKKNNSPWRREVLGFYLTSHPLAEHEAIDSHLLHTLVSNRSLTYIETPQ